MSKIHTLENGLRVVVDNMPGLETTALGVWANAGSIDETQNEHGIAHLLEHMAFKGTKRRTARGLAEEIETVGGHLNAATSHQRTGYYARLLKDDLPLGVDILADILRNPLFDSGELAKEQEVVVQEIAETADTPDDTVFELLMEACWNNAPLARTILGTPNSVRAQSATSLRGFMGRCYGAENLILAAAGNVDEEQLLRLVQSQFGRIAKESKIAPRPAPKFVGGVRHDARDIEQTHLALGFPGVSSVSEDFFAMRLFADVLGGGMSSRLFQEIREERGLAYTVYSFSDSFENCGLAGAYASAEHEQIPLIAELVRREIESMTEKVGQSEIDRARAMLRSSLMMGLESPALRIEAAAGQLFTFGRLTPPKELIDRLNDVTIDDIKRCAALTLSGPRAVAVVGPCDHQAVADAVGVE